MSVDRTLWHPGRKECDVVLGESRLPIAERLSVRRLAKSLGAGVAAIVVVAATFVMVGGSVGGSVAGGGAPGTPLRCGDDWSGGAGTSDWGTAANWSAGVPNGTDVDACIPSGATVTVLDAPFSVGALTLAAGSTLDVGPAAGSDTGSASLSVGSGLQNAGTVALAPGGLIDLGPTSTLTNEPGGLLAFGIDGAPDAPSGYGRIAGGSLDVGGTADPRFVDGFTPSPDAEYFVYRGSATGEFATVLDGATADYSHAGEVGLVGGAPASPTSTTLAANLERSAYGQAVRFTATVTSSGSAPTGSVSFSADGELLGTAPATAGSSANTATLDSSDLGVGSHSVTATYDGGVVSDPSSSPVLTQVVVPDPTSVAVTSTPSNPLPGEPVTYTATVGGVAPAGTGAPGTVSPGTVSFTDDGAPITACQSLLLTAGTSPQEPEATCTETDGPDTAHLIVASYSGDAHDAASQGSLSQTIGQIPTQTSVAASAATITYGQSASFTATVTPTGGSVSPTGTVTFYDDETTPIGTAPLSAAGGTASATLVTSSLMAGDHEVTAAYGGDASSSASSSNAPLRLDVAEAPTTVTLASSANPAVAGGEVTLTATIGSAVPGETGTVQFADDGSMIGSGAVSGGQAAIQTSFLTAGSHPITAVYEGDDDFVGTSSVNTVDETVTPAAPSGLTTTSVVASPGAPTYGESVTLTATVAPPSGTASPTGVVTFTDGSTTLGSSVLSTTDGTTSASMLVTTLPVGANPITASYDDPGLAAGSSGTTAVVVSRAPTSLGIASSDNPYVFGEPVTLSATVFPVTGFGEAGTVTFYDNGSVIGTAEVSYGQAALTTTFHQVGTDLITASYGGEPDFVGSPSGSALSEMAASS